MKSEILSRRNVILGTMASGVLLAAGLRASSRPDPSLLMQGTDQKKAPEFIGETADWINTNGKALRLYGTEGILAQKKAIVLCFWTYGCINCVRTIPFWNDWAKKYAGTDVAILSVHTPELEHERKVENVRAYIEKEKVLFPTLIDNSYKNWTGFQIQVWPSTLLIDPLGRIRAGWAGELDYQRSGAYKRFAKAIELLRKERRQEQQG
jgi:thiol-disulfide isomerase/thioredoxin